MKTQVDVKKIMVRLNITVTQNTVAWTAKSWINFLHLYSCAVISSLAAILGELWKCTWWPISMRENVEQSAEQPENRIFNSSSNVDDSHESPGWEHFLHLHMDDPLKPICPGLCLTAEHLILPQNNMKNVDGQVPSSCHQVQMYMDNFLRMLSRLPAWKGWIIHTCGSLLIQILWLPLHCNPVQFRLSILIDRRFHLSSWELETGQLHILREMSEEMVLTSGLPSLWLKKLRQDHDVNLRAQIQNYHGFIGTMENLTISVQYG